MSICLLLDELSENEKEILMKELIVVSKGGFTGYSKSIEIYPYDIQDNCVYIPFFYGTQKYGMFPNEGFTSVNMKFNGKLREYQEDVVKKAITQLNKTRCTFLSMATGKGKTLTSIYISSLLKVKVCVLLFRVNLFEQWAESIRKTLPDAKIQILDSVCKIDKDCNYYLINPLTVLKRSREDFLDIGLLIADEAHALCSEKLSKSFLHFTPQWCIGLSATPERSDDLHKILDLHYGKERIHVPLWVEHDYYRFNTELVPPAKVNVRGDTDWNSVLEFQATNVQRNEWIVKICSLFPERNILILCKRKNQTLSLRDMLLEKQESVDYITGTKKTYDKDVRILVTTYSKSGVGFDHPKLDMMIIASDVEEMFDQYFGRCVRREDSSPIFIDLVDKNKSLERHFSTRKQYSKSVGGTLKDFRLCFPDFFSEELVIEFEQ